MASNRVGQQDSKHEGERTGRNTAEYKKVKENMERFIETIESVQNAVERLTTKFKEAGWLATHANNITANNLIIQVLNRINNDANEHKVFLQMLRGIPGMNQIVTRMNGMFHMHLYPSSLCNNYPVSLHSVG